MKCVDVEMLELPQLLQEMERYAVAHDVPILNENGRRYYAQFIREAQPHRILELGTAIGYSALLALSLAPSNCVVDTVELSPERYAEAQANFARTTYGKRITQYLGDAGEVAARLAQEGRTYDFIFLDAAKAQYPDYFRKVTPMLEPNGTMVADNVLFRGYVLHPVMVPRRFETIVQRLQEYLKLVQTPPYETEIFPRGDGLARTRVRREGGTI